MRKFMMFCLLASAAAPALARPNDSDDRRAERPRRGDSSADNSSAGSNRAGRAERPQRSEPRSFGNGSGSDSRPRFERRERMATPVDRPRLERRERAQIPVERSAPQGWRSEQRRSGQPRLSRDGVGAPDERRERVRERRAEERNIRNPADAQIDAERRDRWARARRAAQPYDGEWNERTRDRAGRGSIPREGTQPAIRVARDDRNSPRARWRGDWRNDHRYDWRRHRDRNRSIFRIGVYYDPFGWNYRRHNVGWRLWPDYYSSSYWIHDPWMYRLPAAYPGTRWIRYHDDALLVDTWSGEVIDVIHNFFW